MLNLVHYYQAEKDRPARYIGQLLPEFQDALAQQYASPAEVDCTFTHTVTLANGEAVVGEADLRGSEEGLLGGVKLWGKRVLEVLPGSGFLSAYIAPRAGDLVVLDGPATPGDASEPERVRRGWWFVQKDLGFEAQAVYADLTDLPGDLGRFDIAVLADALSGVTHPFRLLQQVAELTDDAIVVSQPVAAEHGSQGGDPPPTVLFLGRGDGQDGLWRHSPAALIRMLVSVGFGAIAVGAAPAGRDGIPHLTLTARRAKDGQVSLTSLPTTAPAAPAPAAVAAPPRPQPAGPAPATPAPAENATLAGDLPLPPPEGRFSVAGTDNVEAFVVLGRAGYRALLAALGRAAMPPEGLGRVLDFGCGVGRVLRYWEGQPTVERYGSDINPDSVAWCRDNLAFAQVDVNGIDPVLRYPDDHFGLVYALSVFTHLPADLQLPWLRELLRIVRPGGYLYLTTHGDSYRPKLAPAQQAQYDRGELVMVGEGDPGSNLLGAFHPPSLVRLIIGTESNCSLVEFRPEGAEGNPTQDSWLVRRT